MGNLRDGGYVVIGIDDTRPEAMLPGLSDADCEGWLAYDDVSARLAAYCDPPLTIELASFSLGTDARVIVLHVREFADIPHLCARDYPDVLRKGALYVRSRRMPETAEVKSSVKMREVLDLAAEKRLRAYVETAQRAGVRLTSRLPAADGTTMLCSRPSLMRRGMSDLTEKVRSRGHWVIVIRPASFVADRVPYEQLDEIIPAAAVRMRGWPVPYADYGRDPLLRGDDWVGQDIDADMVSHYEAWRFFTSGQFSHLRSVSADWREGAEASHVPGSVDAVIEVWEILFYLPSV